MNTGIIAIIIVLIALFILGLVIYWLMPNESVRPLKYMFNDGVPLMENPPLPPAIKWENIRLNEDFERERLEIAAKILAAMMANHMISGKTLQYRSQSALEAADALIEHWKNNALPIEERPTREPEPHRFVRTDEHSTSTRP